MDDINQERFDQLLSWLNPDREQAAERYESIRKRLTKIFVSRGSPVPDDLADATINRVAKKLPEIRSTYEGDPAHYFYKVSNFIWLEQGRKDRLPAVAPVRPKHDEDDERDFQCLETCLQKLPAADRQL